MMSSQQLNINIKISREETPVTRLDNYHLFYREDRYSRYTERFTPVPQTTDRIMAQRVGCRALTVKVQVRSQDTPAAIRGGQSDSLTGFCLSTSDILCHYDSTSAARSYVVLLSPRYIILETKSFDTETLLSLSLSLSRQITRRHIP